MRLLVTGAAGRIGRCLAAGLPGLGHDLRGLDLTEAPPGDEAAYALGWSRASCLEPVAVADALQDIDAVVHLAGNPDEAPLAESLDSHVRTTATLLDAMVERGITRIAYASSNHAVGRTPRRELLTTTARPRPDTFYGVAKVATEALLGLYADRYGLGAVAMRIGSFGERPATRRELATWLSPGDCLRMVHAAVSTSAPGLEVLYGISANTGAWWDLAPGRALGYRPEDDAQDYAADIPVRPDDEAEAAYAGGPFALERFHRTSA